jgi:hypothetical protein
MVALLARPKTPCPFYGEVLEEGVDVVARAGIGNAGAQDPGLQGKRKKDSEKLIT